jgi:hypothetical protein
VEDGNAPRVQREAQSWNDSPDTPGTLMRPGGETSAATAGERCHRVRAWLAHRPDISAEDGRGLSLVELIADQWGHVGTGEEGRLLRTPMEGIWLA